MKNLVETLGNTVKMAPKNKKIPDDFSPDESIRERFIQHVSDGKLACAEAFRLAREFNLPESEIGHYANLCDVHLEKCQIGLFGYGPCKKRLVEKKDHVDPDLVSAVKEKTTDGIIFCAAVFSISESLNIGKIDVGSACETLGIKIKKCRFGAF